MEVILLKNVGRLGALGDKVSVRPGYGRNYLIPSGFAVSATDANLEAFESRRAELEQAAAEQLAEARARRDHFEGMSVTIARRAGEQGRLFGSVGTGDIAEAVTAAGFALSKGEIKLAGGPFRAAGEYEVTLHLHPEVDATITVDVVPED
ncbi:50S ribosomal protein L9 [Thiocapsa marina]|uniref:Large ribosomal subunit protein bL9 n=1 Tax=Thiocapsa marina 5811 TaxID=768671 RepID=F9UEK8_9GAMM|nr:50S ribosomal protein L9 [Thiocapsa marina]EGV17329.1 50S ribosomal protein L9 [Thiocapsa marina 5811]